MTKNVKDKRINCRKNKLHKHINCKHKTEHDYMAN